MLKIIFENEHLIVVDKPAGVLSVPSRFQDKDARPFAAQFIKHIPHKNLFPIHRLDFEVSGLLLFAKTPGAQKVVSDAFEKHTVVKTYEALTEINGDFAPGSNYEWKNKLAKGKRRTFAADYGKLAITEATLEKTFVWDKQECFKWLLRPKTGRWHQLRYHLSSNGAPILGDLRYGAKAEFLNGTIALRATNLKFLEEKLTQRYGIASEISTVSSEDYWLSVSNNF